MHDPEPREDGAPADRNQHGRERGDHDKLADAHAGHDHRIGKPDALREASRHHHADRDEGRRAVADREHHAVCQGAAMRLIRPMPTPSTISPPPSTSRGLVRSAIVPAIYMQTADTTWNKATATPSCVRPQPKSSTTDFSVRPMANRAPPLMNKTRKPTASTTPALESKGFRLTACNQSVGCGRFGLMHVGPDRGTGCVG